MSIRRLVANQTTSTAELSSSSNETSKVFWLGETAVRVCAVVFAIGFIFSGLVYLYLARWTVAHQDYWLLYGTYFNNSWLQTALLKFGGHSLFFPSLIWMANIRLFHGSQQVLFFDGITLMLITFLLVVVPVWRDQTVGLTTKNIATLVLIVANFWMVRAAIAASGGFNVICSLVTLSAVIACLALPRICNHSCRSVSVTIVLCAGFVASFSFGIGLAIWPALILLAWCLRAPMRIIVLIVSGGVITAIVLLLLPPYKLNAETFQGSLLSILAMDINWFLRLIGSPFAYAIFAWGEIKSYNHAIETSPLSTYFGIAGLLLALGSVVPELIRRETRKSSLRLLGLALVIFNLCAFLFITAARSGRGLSTAVAPRYLFWSAFFWAGLFLIAIQRCESKPLLRSSLYVVALALPLVVLPSHYRAALIRMHGIDRAEISATSLLSSVRDDQMVAILFHDPPVVYQLAPVLRRNRLDIFAGGQQDWIGQNASNLFREKKSTLPFAGRCSVAAIITNDDGAPAARVTGQIAASHTCVIVDAAGTMRGLVRSSSVPPWINHVLFLGKLKENQFAGYIRDYDAQVNYAVRAVEDTTISSEAIPVEKKRGIQ